MSPVPPVAVMQGRLLPPVDGRLQAFPGDAWADEFPLAADAGVAAIEWIYDGGPNPLDTDEGARAVAEAARESGVAVASVCADVFIEEPLAERGAAGRERLEWLCERAAAVGAGRIVVPFVDASALETREHDAAAAEQLAAALPTAERAAVEIDLETSLEPRRFVELLERLPGIGVAYDSGNSAALGFDPVEELGAYGARVRNVHVKDRLRDGGSVPLGEGDADLDAVFTELKRLPYRGALVLQVARGADGDEPAWVRKAREDVERRWREAG